MIKLIVGLGNPGQQYEKTRHNAGFLFLDSLAIDYGCVWSHKPEFQSIMSTLSLGGEKVILLKPQSFMNKSGGVVGKVARYYKFASQEILVVHDELDFDAGVIKLKMDGGHAGHNGLRDIISHLGVKDFYRLRVGIGRPKPGIEVADYVLSIPGKSDFQLIYSAVDQGKGYMHQIVCGDMQLVMNRLNSVS